jgi:hypothetical protein
MTTTTTTTAADPGAPVLDDYERMYQRCTAMCAWRTDPVGGRTRMIKDIAREHSATDREITRAFLRVNAGLRPKACEYQDLDAYAAAWRDAIVKELRAYKATADHLFSVVLGRCFDEARFLRWNGGKAAKTHPKARALRAWRRKGKLSKNLNEHFY